MSVCYIDNFSTTLDAAIGTGDDFFTLPSAAVDAIDAALQLQSIGLNLQWGDQHFVPLVLDNGTSIEIVRAFRKWNATQVQVIRGATPITAQIGDTLRCSPVAMWATEGWRLQRHVSDFEVGLAPGSHVVTDTTSAAITAQLEYFDATQPTVQNLTHDHLPAVLEIHNTNGTGRTVSIAPAAGSPVVRWRGGSSQLSIASSVKVAVYTFRMVQPVSSRSAVGQILAEADFYS